MQLVAEAVAGADAARVAAARNYASREALFPKGAAAEVRAAVAREAADWAATARWRAGKSGGDAGFFCARGRCGVTGGSKGAVA